MREQYPSTTIERGPQAVELDFSQPLFPETSRGKDFSWLGDTVQMELDFPTLDLGTLPAWVNAPLWPTTPAEPRTPDWSLSPTWWGDRYGQQATQQERQQEQRERGQIIENSTEASRQAQLHRLPTRGFVGRERLRDELIEQTAAIGYPSDNYRQFTYRPNRRSANPNLDTSRHLASMSIDPRVRGEFSIYGLLEQMPREKRLGTIAHESAHAYTPYERYNAPAFGGESERREAARFVNAAASQSLLTGYYLDGYHAELARQYRDGEISHGDFREETSAILSEMAITNRNGLREVQERQHKVVDDIARQNRILGIREPQKVRLLTDEYALDNDAPKGIDKTLVRLLEGVESYGDLVQHVDSLKDRFYGARASDVVTRRRQQQQGRYDQLLPIPRIVIRQEIRQDRDDEDWKKRIRRMSRAVLRGVLSIGR